MNKTASFLLDELRAQGADRASCRVSRSQKQEINVENNKIALMRTTFDTSAALTAIQNNRRGVMAVNRLENELLKESCASTMELAQASPPDEAYDIAALEDGPTEFSAGSAEGDRALMLERTKEMLETIQKEYPSITILDGCVEFVSGESVVANTNGVNLFVKDGRYGFGFNFSAKDGSRISSLNSSGCASRDLSKPLLEQAGFRELLEQNIRELDAAPLGDKFTGKLLITPHCLPELLAMYIGAFLSDGSLVAKTSLFLNKLGQQVAGEGFNLYADPADPSLCGFAVTADGFRARRQQFVDNGVLKSFALSLYGARKTGGVRAGNYGEMPLIPLGTKPLDKIIGNIERGILLGRLSGGNPSESGDFSGVAKNSFLIENGKITRPVAETMIAGNLASLFREMSDVSVECIDFGAGAYPWLLTDSFVITG